jgi:hypothetical protein
MKKNKKKMNNSDWTGVEKVSYKIDDKDEIMKALREIWGKLDKMEKEQSNFMNIFSKSQE